MYRGDPGSLLIVTIVRANPGGGVSTLFWSDRYGENPGLVMATRPSINLCFWGRHSGGCPRLLGWWNLVSKSRSIALKSHRSGSKQISRSEVFRQLMTVKNGIIRRSEILGRMGWSPSCGEGVREVRPFEFPLLLWSHFLKKNLCHFGRRLVSVEETLDPGASYGVRSMINVMRWLLGRKKSLSSP